MQKETLFRRQSQQLQQKKVPALMLCARRQHRQERWLRAPPAAPRPPQSLRVTLQILLGRQSGLRRGSRLAPSLSAFAVAAKKRKQKRKNCDGGSCAVRRRGCHSQRRPKRGTVAAAAEATPGRLGLQSCGAERQRRRRRSLRRETQRQKEKQKGEEVQTMAPPRNHRRKAQRLATVRTIGGRACRARRDGGSAAPTQTPMKSSAVAVDVDPHHCRHRSHHRIHNRHHPQRGERGRWLPFDSPFCRLDGRPSLGG